jgi:hypothetical protein
MHGVRVLLLVSAMLFGGWTECQADGITVTNWSYTQPTKVYRAYYTALKDNNYSIEFPTYQGSYTYGVLAYGMPVYVYVEDEDKYNYFQVQLSVNGDNYINTNGYIGMTYDNWYSFGTFSYDTQTYDNIFFKNGYNQNPPNNYYIFGVTWNSNPGKVNCWLSWEFVWLGAYEFNEYVVFFVQDNTTKEIVFSQGLQVGDPPLSPVPLPGTALLLGSGLAGLAMVRRWRSRR